MEQREDWNSYCCTHPKKRMTLISIREATRKQTGDPKIAEKEKKTFKSRSKDSGDGSRFVLIFFLVILFC
jgi:hypothetical protein